MSKKLFNPTDITGTYQIDEKRILHTYSHCDDQLIHRTIDMKDVIETFVNPDIVIPNAMYSNARNYIKKIGNRHLKIGVKDDEEPYVVITAFYLPD